MKWPYALLLPAALLNFLLIVSAVIHYSAAEQFRFSGLAMAS